MGIMNKYRPKGEVDPKYEYHMFGMKEGGERLNRGEQDTFLRLFGASAMLLDTIQRGPFNDRLRKINRGDARIKQAFTILRHVLEDLMATAPWEQAEHMKAQLANTSYLTYVGRVSPVGVYKDMGRWMSFEELNMVASICKHACEMCVETDTQHQRRCPVNRVMNLMPIDKPKTTSSCGWLEELGSLGANDP